MILGKAARYGLYAAITMAERPDQLTTAGEVSRLFGVSADHVAKVLHKLARARLARSVRGVGGGYQLAVDPRKLTMLEVVEAVDGPLLPECLGCDRGGGQCAQAAACAIRRVLEEIGQQAYFTMKSVTIATLAKGGGEVIPLRRATPR